ncbi:uncharacterized protein LOC110980278 isoform X3 [Acanthaster planci]|uniref:Uncharacterized protein LOC110980278 isoform X3 n=1 Tax=Acanthaster planci TaxID=133434 RepID=A0A8B7YJD5_ACAPL|nr:uncharacterized protein LOC110980278 isoform X3 [Acanthaster planci]
MLRPYVIISADSEVYVNHPALQSQAETATLILFCFLILSSNVKKMFEISTGRLMAVFLVLLLAWHSHSGDLDPEDESNPHRDPSKCEVCKFVAQELQETMTETGKKKEVLQIGHQFDKQKKEIKYHKSELRLIEALDDVCERILQYNIHAERASSRSPRSRFREWFPLDEVISSTHPVQLLMSDRILWGRKTFTLCILQATPELSFNINLILHGVNSSVYAQPSVLVTICSVQVHDAPCISFACSGLYVLSFLLIYHKWLSLHRAHCAIPSSQRYFSFRVSDRA